MSKQDKAFNCSQCGASELKQTSGGKLRCTYCGSIYKIASRGPSVIIKKGANVVFGKNAKVIIAGGMEIEDGANVKVEGEITLLKRAPEKDIAAAKLRLDQENKIKRTTYRP